MINRKKSTLALCITTFKSFQSHVGLELSVNGLGWLHYTHTETQHRPVESHSAFQKRRFCLKKGGKKDFQAIRHKNVTVSSKKKYFIYLTVRKFEMKREHTFHICQFGLKTHRETRHTALQMQWHVYACRGQH